MSTLTNVPLDNLLTQWARLLLASLADAGVRHVVLSPGSRSTPYLIAAANEPRLICHDSFDERAGGFFALGQARVTGLPSVCICTSGTAAAHYLPAVVEASQSYLPLIVLTSDRPLELQDAGAAQTIDQIKLMGSFARRFYELGNPDPSPTALAGLRRLAVQAVHFSQSPVPGPVHLNARASKPLEPRTAANDDERALEHSVDRLLARPNVQPHLPVASPDPSTIALLADCCRSAERGLIVCGPAPAASALSAHRAAVAALARATGFPILAETTSQLRRGPHEGVAARCDAFDAVLQSRSFRTNNAPQLIIQLGAPPASSGFEQYVAAHQGTFEHVVITPYGWLDPVSSATEMVFGDPQLVLEAIAAQLPSSTRASRWADLWTTADRLAWDLVDVELERDRESGQLGEGLAVSTVVDAVPEESLFMVGNSLPIREVDTFSSSGGADITVLSQRGANGIDGLIAGASGSATTSERPVTLLLGDVSFLHDLTGLSLAQHAGGPLVIVILNNRGGRIFEQLPLANAPGLPHGIMDHVVTPHEAELEHAALLFGYPHRWVSTVDELEKELDDAYNLSGCSVVEAVVSPHGAAEQHRRILAAVDEAVAALTL